MSADEKDPDSPATTSFAYDEMAPRWDMISTLLGGTRSMRAAGTRFLPMHEAESNVNYSNRLGVNTLFNMTELTLDSLVGRPFSDPVTLSEDMPSEIVDLTEDIDLQGNNLSTFCRAWMREGIAKAFSHVVIDFPRIAAEEEDGGAPRTLADDRQENLRPYWLHVPPENVIFASSTVVAGQEVLTHVRILKIFTVQEGFSETVKTEILILEPGRFEVWIPVKQKAGNKVEWEAIDFGETGLDFIPLVTFYADRTGLMTGKPPLEDLSFLNVAHWQSTADQRNILTVARFPMLAVSGAQDQAGTTMEIGPRKLLTTRDPQGRFYYVEHTGKAMATGQQDLDDLVEQMCAYGADFLKKRVNGQTATARALDAAEATSPLQDMTVRFIDAVNTALAITAVWLELAKSPSEGAGGTVTISTDFGPEEANDADLKTLVETRATRQISRKAYLEELKRRGLLADDYDGMDDLQQLIAEQDLLAALGGGDEGQQGVAEMRGAAGRRQAQGRGSESQGDPDEEDQEDE